MLCHQWVHFFCSIPFCFVLFIHSFFFCWIPFCSIVLYSVLFYSILLCSILYWVFYFTLLYVCYSWSESGQWSSDTDYAIACSILYSIPFYFLDFSWSVSRLWPSYTGCVSACWSRWFWCWTRDTPPRRVVPSKAAHSSGYTAPSRVWQHSSKSCLY